MKLSLFITERSTLYDRLSTLQTNGVKLLHRAALHKADNEGKLFFFKIAQSYNRGNDEAAYQLGLYFFLEPSQKHYWMDAIDFFEQAKAKGNSKAGKMLDAISFFEEMSTPRYMEYLPNRRNIYRVSIFNRKGKKAPMLRFILNEIM